MIPRVTLRQLRVFVAVAQDGNVTRAAARIAISQSAASQSLAELEQELGLQLFDRQSRRLLLNEDGRRLYPKAVAILDSTDEFEQLAQNRQGSVHLRAAASSTIGNYLLPQFIGGFLQAVPGSRIDLSVGNTADVVEAVRDLRVELGFVEGTCSDPEIHTLFWRQDHLTVFCSPQHPLALRRRLRPEELRRFIWVMREHGSGTREAVEQSLARAKIDMTEVIERGHSEAIKQLVAGGTGISCLSRLALENDLASGRLHALPTSFLKLKRPLFVLWRRDKFLGSGIRRFLDWCDVDIGRMQEAGDEGRRTPALRLQSAVPQSARKRN